MKCAKCGKVPKKVKYGFIIFKKEREEEKKLVRICPYCSHPVFVYE